MREKIPDSWRWVPLEGVTQPIEKINPSHTPNEKYTYIEISSIDNSRYVVTTPKIVLGKEASSRARQKVQKGDVLFSNVRTYLKNIAQVPSLSGEVVATTGFTVLRGEQGVLNKYLYYFTLTDAFTSSLSELQRGTSYPSVRESDVRSQLLPLAPFKEQKRIVAQLETQLDRLQHVIDGLERIKKSCEHYRQSLLTTACEGKLVPQNKNDEPASELLKRILVERRKIWEENTWQEIVDSAKQMAAKNLREESGNPLKQGENLTLDEWEHMPKSVYESYLPDDDNWKHKYKNPKTLDTDNLHKLKNGWCWTNLDELKLFSRYGPRFSSSDYAPNGILVLRTSDIDDSGKVDLSTPPRLLLSDSDFKKYKCELGDLLITRTGSLGTLAVFNDKIDAIPGAYLIHYRLTVSITTCWYVYYFLKSPFGQHHILANALGVGRPNLNVPTLESLAIPLPPLAEQRRIIQEVEKRLSIINKIEQIVLANLEYSMSLRQSILEKAFTGNLAPQEKTDQPVVDLLKQIAKEREQRQVETKKVKKKRPRKKPVKKKLISLFDALKKSKQKQLTPKQLFDAAGYESGADIVDNHIDHFYEELRNEVVHKKRIVEIRPNQQEIYLQVASHAS